MMRSRMEERSDNRTRMLAQIRNALGRPAATVAPEPLPPFDSHIPKKDNASLIEIFSRELENVGGRLICAQSAEELRQLLQEISSLKEYASVAVSTCEVFGPVGPTRVINTSTFLIGADLGITCADYPLADTGTLVLVYDGEQHRLISLLPPVHVCLLDPPTHLCESHRLSSASG
jgi:L-lactate dehydrogenase complex protein LldG